MAMLHVRMISLDFFGISKVVTSPIPLDRINLKKESNGFRAANRISRKDIRKRYWLRYFWVKHLFWWNDDCLRFFWRMSNGRNVKSQFASCLVIPSLTKTSPAWDVQSCYGKTLGTSKLVQEICETSSDNPAFFLMICIIVSCTHVSYM